MRRIARAALAVGLSAALPASGLACSMTPFAALLPRNFVYFLGSARADTLPVSPGSALVDSLGRSRAASPRFGQSARVARLGSTLAREDGAALDAALGASDSVVVLVPWELTAGCAPAPWGSSVRWIRPGTDGLFRGQLRPRREWVGGVPTLDVFLPSIEPYPGGPSGDSSWTRSGGNRRPLAAAELFDLFRALPVDVEMRRTPDAATAALRQWVDANPRLATRYPAADLVREARWAAHHYRVRLTGLPLAGTYHFTVGLSDGQQFSFYARTEPSPSATWDDARLAERAESLPWVADPANPAAGFDAEVIVARDERDLPGTRAEAARRRQAVFTFRIASSPTDDSRGTRRWRGSVAFAGEALTVLATDSASGVRLLDLAERARQVSSLADPRSLPATFRQLPNGRVEVSQQLRLHDGRLLTIRGARVSDLTVAPSE